MMRSRWLRTPIFRFIAKRIGTGILVLLGITIAIFVALSLVPGDPTQIIMGYAWTPEGGEALREKLGLNDPLHVRFGRFVWNALHGELGFSYVSGNIPVLPEVVRAFKASLQLTLTALLISLPLSMALGILSSVKQRSVIDISVRALVLGLSSIPTFVLGLYLMYIFSVQLRILPALGTGGIEYLILPATTLSCFSVAGMLRMTRGSMLDILRQDYIRAAKARGLRKKTVIFKHALRNALNPIITLTGLYAGVMLGSAIITEYVFAWPGLGYTIIAAIQARDVPMIQGCALVIAGGYVVINMTVDILYAYLDPRVRV